MAALGNGQGAFQTYDETRLLSSGRGRKLLSRLRAYSPDTSLTETVRTRRRRHEAVILDEVPRQQKPRKSGRGGRRQSGRPAKAVEAFGGIDPETEFEEDVQKWANKRSRLETLTGMWEQSKRGRGSRPPKMKRTEVRGWYPELFRTDKEALEEVRAEMQVSAGVWFDPDAEGTDEEGNINTFSHTRLVDGRSAWGGLRTLREPGSAFGMGWAFPPPPSYCFPPPAPRGWYPLSTEANWMHAHPHYYAGERLASELIGGPEVHRDPMHVVSVPVPVPAPGLPVGYGHAPTGPSLVSHPHEIRQSAADFQSVDHFRDPCGQPSPPLPATSSKPPQQAVSLVPSRSHRSPPAVTRHPLSEIDSLVNAAPQPPVASGRDSRNSGAGGGAVAGEKKRRSRLEVPMPTSRLHPPPAISTRGRRTDGPQGGAYSGSLSGVPGGDSLRPWGSLLPSVDSPPAVPQRDSLFLSLDAHSAVERGTGGGKIK